MTIYSTPFPHVMHSLGPSTPRYTFLIFYASIEDGQMWCSDCRHVEGTVKEAFEGSDKPKLVIYWVGKEAEWKNQPKNKARIDWNISAVPTILRLERGQESARLEDTDILDKGKLRAFMYPDGEEQ